MTMIPWGRRFSVPHAGRRPPYPPHPAALIPHDLSAQVGAAVVARVLTHGARLGSACMKCRPNVPNPTPSDGWSARPTMLPSLSSDVAETCLEIDAVARVRTPSVRNRLGAADSSLRRGVRATEYQERTAPRRPGGGMADAADLKSALPHGGTGSTPVPGTSFVAKPRTC